MKAPNVWQRQQKTGRAAQRGAAHPVASVSDRGAVEIVSIGPVDLHCRDLTDAQRSAGLHINRTVDLRRVALAAALGGTLLSAPRWLDFVDDHALAGTDPALEAPARNLLLAWHEAALALGLERLGNRRGEIVRRRAGDRLVAETADAIEFRRAEPVDEGGKILLGLAREPDDEGRAD